MTSIHIPVLLSEAIEALKIKPDEKYIDLTLGGCGHAKAILARLSPSGRLLGFDRDNQAIEQAKKLDDCRLLIRHLPFNKLNDELAKIGWQKVSGILIDLGISSMQLDSAERGFSYSQTGRLDMRMDIRQELDAEKWINHIDEKTLKEVIKYEGEERNAGKIAKAIIKNRSKRYISTTTELSAIIRNCLSAKENWRSVASRTFQAIRIHINAEHSQLSSLLPQIPNLLNTGGRLVVISFHSLEDRTIKNFINSDNLKRLNAISKLPKGFPISKTDINRNL